jgi:hypothetical protein
LFLLFLITHWIEKTNGCIITTLTFLSLSLSSTSLLK